jgi:hypothetical protein
VTCVTTVIVALVPRHRAGVAGDIASVAAFERPWVRTDAVLEDGTGVLVLRFFGRAAVLGLAVKSHVVVEGTPAFVRGVLVMRNPVYSFVGTE